MQTFRFYSALPATTNARIDRQNAILRGVTAMQAGVEAIGHGCQADLQTLYTLATMGNANPKGIRGRFGHPAISENATGKQVQVAKNFRVEGNNLVHDSHLLQTARKSPVFTQDPVEFLLDLAEKTPTEFGESVVIEADLVWTLDDGSEVSAYEADNEWPDGRPANALTPLPVLRPMQFHYLDVVNEGALTHDGLFPASAQMAQMFFAGHSSEFADQIFQTVDAWRERYNIPLSALPEKVEQVVSTYMALRQKDNRIMRKKYTMEQEPVDAVIDTPVEETEIEETDPVDDALADAEVLAASLTNDDGHELAISTQLQQAFAQIATLSAQVQRMSSLLVKNLEATATIHRNMRRMNGEPVVSEQVPTSRQNSLEALQQYAHPTPPSSFLMNAGTPVHMSERGGNDAYGVTPNDTPGVAAMKQQTARNARLGR